MNQRKCRIFSVLNEEQPASWPHLPLRPLPAVRLAWNVSIKIAERNCLETLPYINRSVLKKRAACIGTVQNEGDWAQPNKHFAKQKWHLYRQKPCLPVLSLNQNNFGITTVLTIPHDGGGGRHWGTESPQSYALGGADEHAESTSKGSHPIRKSKTKWSVFKLIRVAETIWTVVNLSHAKSCFANF